MNRSNNSNNNKRRGKQQQHQQQQHHAMLLSSSSPSSEKISYSEFFVKYPPYVDYSMLPHEGGCHSDDTNENQQEQKQDETNQVESNDTINSLCSTSSNGGSVRTKTKSLKAATTSVIKPRTNTFPFMLHQMLDLTDRYPDQFFLHMNYSMELSVQEQLQNQIILQIQSQLQQQQQQEQQSLLSLSTLNHQVERIMESMDIRCFRPCDIIRWENHGRSFLIMDKVSLVKYFFPLFLPYQTEYASFQRQLNFYGFIRLPSSLENSRKSQNIVSGGGATSLRYYHEKFLRTRPDLCTQLQRSYANRKRKKESSSSSLHTFTSTRLTYDPASEPNFNSFPPLLPRKNPKAESSLLSSSQQPVVVVPVSHERSLFDSDLKRGEGFPKELIPSPMISLSPMPQRLFDAIQPNPFEMIGVDRPIDTSNVADQHREIQFSNDTTNGRSCVENQSWQNVQDVVVMEQLEPNVATIFELPEPSHPTSTTLPQQQQVVEEQLRQLLFCRQDQHQQHVVVDPEQEKKRLQLLLHHLELLMQQHHEQRKLHHEQQQWEQISTHQKELMIHPSPEQQRLPIVSNHQSWKGLHVVGSMDLLEHSDVKHDVQMNGQQQQQHQQQQQQQQTLQENIIGQHHVPEQHLGCFWQNEIPIQQQRVQQQQQQEEQQPLSVQPQALQWQQQDQQIHQNLPRDQHYELQHQIPQSNQHIQEHSHEYRNRNLDQFMEQRRQLLNHQYELWTAAVSASKAHIPDPTSDVVQPYLGNNNSSSTNILSIIQTDCMNQYVLNTNTNSNVITSISNVPSMEFDKEDKKEHYGCLNPSMTNESSSTDSSASTWRGSSTKKRKTTTTCKDSSIIPEQKIQRPTFLGSRITALEAPTDTKSSSTSTLIPAAYLHSRLMGQYEYKSQNDSNVSKSSTSSSPTYEQEMKEYVERSLEMRGLLPTTIQPLPTLSSLIELEVNINSTTNPVSVQPGDDNVGDHRISSSMVASCLHQNINYSTTGSSLLYLPINETIVGGTITDVTTTPTSMDVTRNNRSREYHINNSSNEESDLGTFLDDIGL